MRPLLPASCLALAATLAVAAPVQGPAAEWLTFTTPHYRIHCPKAFEPFGQEVANRVEGIHAQYLGLIGFVYEKPIDILILDPVMDANGMALPLLDRPHVVLWKTAPEGDSVIGHHRGWAELLLTHELGHMHHLLRPARKANFLQRWTAVLGPIPQKAPRWVTEGYATLIEGKLTGSGRPHSAIRAAVLRQWALEGKLPTYEALSASDGFLGGSMAYLGGSAYLEWLETHTKEPKVFQTLWVRLAGKRDFDAAFLATFGFGPKDGYQRFCAELTHTALELERRMKAEGLREGELLTQLKGWATDLSLSPDGTKLLARVLDPKKPGLYVWDLKTPPPPPKATKKDLDEPADLAPVSVVRPPTRRLGRLHGSLPWKPLWTAPNTISYELRLPDGEGVLKPQPRRWVLAPSAAASQAPILSQVSWKEVAGIWTLVDGQGRPLTRTLAPAWNPVVSPDGKWIYYTQLSATGLQIRKLDASLPLLPAKPLPLDPAALVQHLILPKADEPSPLPKPDYVEPQPYLVTSSHKVDSRLGYSTTPSGISYQVGLGGNDLLNRLSWQVLAGFGNGTGPRGAMLGAAWRGWTWAPSLQVFSTLDQPSRQDFLAVQGFDRERRGVELAFERQSLARPTWELRPAVAFERITPNAGEAFPRTLAGTTASLGNHWSWDGQGLRLSTQAQAFLGRTGGEAWNLSRVALSAAWLNPWMPLTLRAETGRLGGQPTSVDLFHLGGVATSLLPTTLDANRVAQAALPSYTAKGNRLQALRGELRLGVLNAYLDQVTVWQDPLPRPSAQRVAGLELNSRNLGLPLDLLRRLTGDLSFTLGVHRPLDGLLKGRTVGTISVIVRP
jgi:hypothetical protein